MASDGERQLFEWHANGIHLYCAPGTGEESDRDCRWAGTMMRWHGHDFEGLLPCGCPELGQ